MERLMTINEVAEFLNMRKAQVYLLTHQKRIPHLKKIGGLRFRRDAIEKWLDSNAVQLHPQTQPKPAGRRGRGRPKGNNSIADERIEKMVENAQKEALSSKN